MGSSETRVRTRDGTLVVTDHAVRLERGPLRRVHQEIPRATIMRVRLTSRFHTLPLLLGGLLLAASLTIGALHSQATKPVLPSEIAYSLILVLVIGGLFCLLALPLSYQARLLIHAADRTPLQVRTGYHRTSRLEKAYTRLHDDAHAPKDLVASRVNTPSGPHPGSG